MGKKTVRPRVVRTGSDRRFVVDFHDGSERFVVLEAWETQKGGELVVSALTPHEARRLQAALSWALELVTRR